WFQSRILQANCRGNHPASLCSAPLLTQEGSCANNTIRWKRRPKHTPVTGFSPVPFRKLDSSASRGGEYRRYQIYSHPPYPHFSERLLLPEAVFIQERPDRRIDARAFFRSEVAVFAAGDG